MNLQYLILFVCFVGVLDNCYADDGALFHKINGSLSSQLQEKQVIPDCYFGVESISFILFTREIKDGIVLTIQNITNSEVFRNDKLRLPIVFLVHGFVSSANNSNYENLAQVLLEKKNVIVISIDWKKGACDNGLSILKYFGYYNAVRNTPEVGQYIANMTKILVQNFGVSMKNIQIIGHSLGAHVAGFAGKEMKKCNFGMYRRITALDPAGPLFSGTSCWFRLCHTDAEYVQVIHTTASLGTEERLGHIDFYVNGGVHQPSCDILKPSCSHSRAVQYLTECLKHKCCLIGVPWKYIRKRTLLSNCPKEICACIGLDTKNYPADGSYYVPVGKKFPYCRNETSGFH